MNSRKVLMAKLLLCLMEIALAAIEEAVAAEGASFVIMEVPSCFGAKHITKQAPTHTAYNPKSAWY